MLRVRRNASSYCFLIRFGFGSFIAFIRCRPSQTKPMSTKSGQTHASLILGTRLKTENLGAADRLDLLAVGREGARRA
jgi:hypothetical protein